MILIMSRYQQFEFYFAFKLLINEIKSLIWQRTVLRFCLLVFCAHSMCSCSTLLYYPTDIKYVSESKLKYPPTELSIKLDDKIELTAWLFEPPNPQLNNTIFVFFHGNGQNLSAHFRSLYWILDYEYSFLIFDYPGYGTSSGVPTPKNTIESGVAALKWVKQKYPNRKLAVFSQSLGGNVALSVLSELNKTHSEEIENLCLVVAESSFPSYQNVAQKMLNKKWFTWPLQWLPYLVLSDSHAISKSYSHLPNSNYISIHGEQDALVPFEQGEKLFQLLPPTKEFWKISGGGHINTFTSSTAQTYRERLIQKIKLNCKN